MLDGEGLASSIRSKPMLARCGSCGVGFVVPDDKAANPRLGVRCQCGFEFALHEPKPPRVETPVRCEGLCTDVAKLEEDTAREKQRSRTMRDDIGFISAYPFSDPAAYVSLATGCALGLAVFKKARELNLD